METGKVKWYSNIKGYGFILDDNSDAEYFVHKFNLLDNIKGDNNVIFEINKKPDGRLEAIRVKKI